jgi:hypothetical protein
MLPPGTLEPANTEINTTIPNTLPTLPRSACKLYRISPTLPWPTCALRLDTHRPDQLTPSLPTALDFDALDGRSNFPVVIFNVCAVITAVPQHRAKS